MRYSSIIQGSIRKFSCGPKASMIEVLYYSLLLSPLVQIYNECENYSSAMDGYAQSWMWTCVLLIACGETKREV